MHLVYKRSCGIDVHKKFIVACILLAQEDGTEHKEIRTFSTMTADLLACVDWLESKGIEMVAMESTGVFWRPVFNLLEAHIKVMLVNAQHMKALPGRKTDVKDSEWIADLLRHGLLEASFIRVAHTFLQTAICV
jgi:transposase